MNDDVGRVTIRDCSIGGPDLVVMAGPCAIESRELIFQIAEVVAASGGRFLRGGAFKVRTAPTAFQGLGWDGWKLLREAADAFGLLTVSEILEEQQIEKAREYIDLAQIGSRNMQNTPLLKAFGRSGIPVMLKRGFGCTIEEWVHAAEYILDEGNENVLLCERGIRTFETATRFTLDVAAVPIAKARLGVPVIVDPSHAAGKRDWVECLTLSGVAPRAVDCQVRRAPGRRSLGTSRPAGEGPTGRHGGGTLAPLAGARGRRRLTRSFVTEGRADPADHTAKGPSGSVSHTRRTT
jgi:3-deoxy-7-phosphoheptulonate synthase